MKLQFKKSDLTNAINIVLKAVPSKTPMSILECILIDASNGVIHLVGNDNEFGIETICKGTIEVPGKVALEAKIFSEIIRRLPEAENILLTIETDERNNTVITCENSVLKLQDVTVTNLQHYRPSIKTRQYRFPSFRFARSLTRRFSRLRSMIPTRR